MEEYMTFDLHFTDSDIKPLTQKGREFLAPVSRIRATPNNYQVAVDQGLHVSFENAGVRDWVTGAAFSSLVTIL
jgi:hypothetical protein